MDSKAPPPRVREPIAIIGMGCRMPQADGLDAYWRLLTEGIDAIVEVPLSRWNADALWSSDPTVPGKTYCRWGGFLADADCFDAGVFGITASEAARMDPQQGMVLESAWHALEHAGIAPDSLRGSSTGVFVGMSCSDYDRRLCSDLRNLELSAGTGTSYSIVANRLSYVLGLCGPSIAVDLACASSLVAVHLACQSLAVGESDLALAGGVHLMLSPEKTITFSRGKVLARDGRCKSFAHNADGYVRGEGCGIVVLKRLSDARRDGDLPLAVILGSAVNHNGASNGLSAPLRVAQEKVVRAALSSGNIDPTTIGYVEAHSPGTLLGDLLEMRALATVLCENRSPGQTCFVGSVKSNIGHLEGAAGIASLIKAVLAVNSGTIPRTLHARELNSNLPVRSGVLEVAQHPAAWAIQPRRAGVSSFSFGGANAHVVIENASEEDVPLREPLQGALILPISARSASALRRLASEYAVHLEEIARRPDAKALFADVCFTAALGRSSCNHRFAVIAHTPDEAAHALIAFSKGELIDGSHAGVAMPSRGRTPSNAEIDSSNSEQGVPMKTIANAYVSGATPRWQSLFDETRRKRRLPLYPFERSRYWRDDFAAETNAAAHAWRVGHG